MTLTQVPRNRLADARIVPTSFGLSPHAANAADALSRCGSGGTGTAVIHHGSNPNTDQIFAVSVVNAVGDAAAELSTLTTCPAFPAQRRGAEQLAADGIPERYLWGTLSFAAPYIGDDPRLRRGTLPAGSHPTHSPCRPAGPVPAFIDDQTDVRTHEIRRRG